MRYLLLLLCLGCATESDVATWGTEIVRDATESQTGVNSVRFEADKVGAIRSDYRPVIPGHPYRAFAALKDDQNGAAGQDTIRLYVQWFTRAKVSIATADVFADAYPDSETWLPVSVIADAPATAAFCQLIAHKTLDTNSVTLWVDHFDILPFPFAFRATGNMVGMASGGVAKVLEIDTEDYDHGGWFNPGTYKATIKAAGLYALSAAVRYVHPVALFPLGNKGYIQVFKNTIFYENLNAFPLLTSEGNLYIVGADTILFAEGDVVELRGFHSEGVALNLDNMRFAMSKVE